MHPAESAAQSVTVVLPAVQIFPAAEHGGSATQVQLAVPAAPVQALCTAIPWSSGHCVLTVV
jgi:hypothetical protein